MIVDTEVYPDGLEIYSKPTNTGQYALYTSFPPWRYTTAWITDIIRCATVTCDERELHAERNRIKKLISRNDFPK